MIGSLRGEVLDRRGGLDKEGAEILLEVQGVGYRVVVTPTSLAQLAIGTAVMLHIHHHHWEADQRLYGFLTRDERDAFEGLLAAHKVGPALALAVIATYPPAQLAMILDNDDLDALCQVPGVGKKTAQRLLVDLKSTLVLPVLDTPDGGPIDLTGGPSTDPQVVADVREALSNLGYGAEDIKTAVKAAITSSEAEADAGALLKAALRSMAGS